MKSGCIWLKGVEVKWFTCALDVCLSSENSAFGELWLILDGRPFDWLKESDFSAFGLPSS